MATLYQLPPCLTPTGSSAASTPLLSASTGNPLLSAGTKRKLLMHDDLRAALEDDIYHALDASAGLSATERLRLHKACLDGNLGVLLNNTTSAAFGHQFVLFLTEDSHFHPCKRGLALANTGRSAAASSAPVDVVESMTRNSFLRMLRDHWVAYAPNRLWEGVTFVMKVHAPAPRHGVSVY